MKRSLKSTAALALGLLAAPLYAKVANKVVATVNGEAIWLAELDKTAVTAWEQYKKFMPETEGGPEKEADVRKKILDQMVDDKILLQQAKERKIKVNKRDLEDGITEVKSRFRRDESGKILSEAAVESAFANELKKEGLNLEQFQERIKEQLMVIRLIDEEVKSKTPLPTDAELRKLFGEVEKRMNDSIEPEDAKTPEEQDLQAMARFFKDRTSEQVRAKHILIQVPPDASLQDKSAARKKLEDLKQRLVKGEDFEDLARKYSQDTESAARGGDLGYFSKGRMVPSFEKAAFALPVGGLSDIVETKFGYHLIKVEEKRAAQKLKYEDVKEDLTKYLFQKSAAERFQKWMTDLRKKADIKIHDLN